MTIPHIFIKKGAVLKGVELVGLNVVFEIDELPTGGNDSAMLEALEKTVEAYDDIVITGCMRSNGRMFAEETARRAIQKAKRSSVL